MMTKDIAARVQRNMQRASVEPEGSCFLVSRALQILAGDGGELVECRLNQDQHVIYLDASGLYWDLTTHGISGGGELQLGVAELPESYTDLAGYDWPEDFSCEFAETLVDLCRP